MSIVNSVRNSDGIWVNTQIFREEANHFTKYGYYCPDPWGTPSWRDYWTEQLRRTKEGYEVGGARITGDHYFYMNFCPILKVDIFSKNKKNQSKQQGFPDFWDGDYNYFWAIDIARHGVLECGLTTEEESEHIASLDNLQQALELKKLLEGLNLEVKIHQDYLLGGYHVVVGKARRKGYSFKNAAKLVNKYNNTRNSLSIVGAFDKKYLYPKGTMAMASAYLNFLNEHTGWRKSRDFVNKQDHRKASFSETINGNPIEKGYQSEIIALTFKDNPDAARGKDAQLFLFEEAGAFPNLKSSYLATEPALRAGNFVTGQIIIFGTGGDMEGGTIDFADMFYDPKPYNLLPFHNIWDDNAEESTCGFFHPIYWNMEGHYDKEGNSDVKKAIAEEDAKREKIRKESANASSILQAHVQEWCKTPSEGFLTVSVNDFPVQELRNQLNKVTREQLHTKKGQPVVLYREAETGRVRAKPDLNNELTPIYHYKPKVKDLSGCPIIYEYPISEKPPRGLYKAGYDPYKQDQSAGPSLGSFYVYKGNSQFSYSRDQIVAEYVGRPATVDQFHRNVELLAELYNLELMHENEVPGVINYFKRRKKLHLLAAQPDEVISKNIKASKVSRVYGIHMNDKLKDAGAKYIKKWLLTMRDVDENGNQIMNLETIYSPGLLEELILFNLKGNFDRVMSFMMVMFQLEEEDLGKEYKEDNNSNAKDLLNMIPKMYSRSQQKTLLL